MLIVALARCFVPVALTAFGLLRKEKKDPAGRLKRGKIVPVAPAASEAESYDSSLLVAGLVCVTKVVGTSVLAAAAVSLVSGADTPEGTEPAVSVTMTVSTGTVVVYTEVVTTGPAALAVPATVAFLGIPDAMVTLQDAASSPQVPKAD